jgi:Fe-S-cluster containining protein
VADMTLKVLQTDSDLWYRDGLSFSCTQCGNCCTGAPGYVWISDVEIGRMAEYLKISREEVIDQYCRRVGNKISLQERRTAEGNYDCIFLEERRTGVSGPPKRTCTVYPVRPLQCRTWPFWDGNLMSRENWERASKRCPGMDRGKPHSLKKIEALRTAEDWPK